MLALGIYLFFQPIHMPRWMTYPYDVTFLGGQATINSYLSDKKEVSIPDRMLGIKVRYIMENAFGNLGTDVVISEIPESLYHAMKLYDHESQSYYNLSDHEARMTEYAGSEKRVHVPVEVWEYTVTDIQANCFLYSDVEEVTIPESITYIGGGAFRECKNLEQIVLPSHLEELGNHAFMYSGIQEIILPQTVKEIGEEAFAYSALKEIIGLENVEYIGDRAFRGTPWEDSIEEEFVCIDDILYLYKGAETEVVIPSTIKEIRGGFYKEDEYPYPINVTKVFVPESVTVISPESFAGQKGLEVYIPESVISLGDDYGNPSDPYKECIFENIKDGTIVTTEGSTAEAYAISQRIPYRIITEEEMQQEMEAAERRPYCCIRHRQPCLFFFQS